MTTSDRNHPDINVPQGEGQQNKAYLVLSDEERARGFVRPLRTSYVHVGRFIENASLITEEYAKQLKEQFNQDFKAMYDITVDLETNRRATGFLTDKEWEQWKINKHVGGCGTETRMNLEISETYAVDPSFYHATWCCGCKAHHPVSEFVWSGSDDKVGS